MLPVALISTFFVVERTNVICFWNMTFIVMVWLAALTIWGFEFRPPKPKTVAHHCLLQSVYHIYITILTADIIKIKSIMIRCVDGKWLDVFKNTSYHVNKYWPYYGSPVLIVCSAASVTRESESSIWTIPPQGAHWRTYFEIYGWWWCYSDVGNSNKWLPFKHYQTLK
jgi:hypothetical protein